VPKEPENLDLYDEHEEVVSEGGKKVRRRGIYLVSGPSFLLQKLGLHVAHKDLDFEVR
jgi:hypothetical protein